MQSNKNKHSSAVQAVVRVSSSNLTYNNTKYAVAYKARFHRELLPSPQAYYLSTVEGFTIVNPQQARSHCPFHDDKNPSFSMNMKSGAFNCFACGSCGGDIIDFHMLRHGFGFVTACRDLEVWYE